MDIFELWPDPRDGLPPDDAPWDWDEENRTENGPTKNPPNTKGGWYRWYFTYHMPKCTRVRVSADRDPESGLWFNPHLSSGN